ncbi:MAG TPA: beta/gamma crystallin-related protein [Usitatibacter sp.]|nr:beta/gamma crystallin-related protein [Usitatibacter sp.]
MKQILTTALAAAGLAMATQAAAQITFYEHDGFRGRSLTIDKQLGNFQREDFGDRASSAIVTSGRWEVCEERRFEGRCVVLRPGQYPSLQAMGIENDRATSARPVMRNARVEENRYAPAPLVERDYRRRPNERIYEADVTSVRAVVGERPEQRCWVEREQVSQGSDRNIGGAIAGAVIGGILGHQVGSGRGNDAATAGGAVVGGLVGSNVGRDNNQGYGRDVRRCENVQSSAAPAYYDVTYNFRGREYRVQMAQPPGRTVQVNAQGEPRA